MKKNKNTCIAVCTLNAEENISKVLETCSLNVEKNNLIIVDGRSKDKTISISKKFTDNIFFDNGTGLAAARNIALKNCNKDYIFYVGPDNLIIEGLVNSLIEEMNDNNWVGISSLSFYKDPQNYFEKSFNLYKRSKFSVGERKIIGTPWLYKTEILKKMKWTDGLSYSDDTDLCQRLEKLNLRIGISKKSCFEIGTINFFELRKRWKLYGRSDYEFYTYNTSEFSFFRKVRSFFNAFFVDFIKPISSREIKLSRKIYILPFLIMITSIRFTKFISILIKTKI
jgi:glycosyltransferase involved in cell wall biosynthesis